MEWRRWIRVARLLACGLVSTVVSVSAGATPAPYTLVKDGVSHEVVVIQRDGLDLLSLVDLAEALGGAPVAGATGVVEIGGSRVVVRPGADAVEVEGTVYRYSRPSVLENGMLYVPTDFVTKVFAAILDRAVRVADDAEKLLTPAVEAQEPIPAEVQVRSQRDYTRVLIRCPEERVLPYTINMPAGRIVLRIQADNLTTERASYDIADGALERISFSRVPGRGTFTFELGEDYRDHQTAVMREPFRVVVDIYRKRPRLPVATPTPVAVVEPLPSPIDGDEAQGDARAVDGALTDGSVAAGPGGDLLGEGAQLDVADEPEAVIAALGRSRTGRFRTVVIDPGHGGSESGAAGPTRLLEKEITLDLAQRLKGILERNLGLRVVLTRSSDQNLPLEQRTSIANHQKADLFLSIHANASLRRNARGAETYFLAADATDDEWRTHNAMSTGAVDEARGMEGTDLELILWSLAQNQYQRESEALAAIIQRELNQELGIRDRGVKQAPFTVLVGATMPAVLVEVGFISNPTEEKQLRDDAYKNRIVEALYRSIRRFKQAHSNVKMGSLASAP